MGRDAAILAVAVGARAQQDHGGQRNPAAHRMHHHATGKVMKLGAGQAFDPALHAKMLVPGNALKKRVDKADDDRRGDQLRPEAGALGNAAEIMAGMAAANVSRKKNLTSSKPFLAANCSAPTKKWVP